MELIDLIFNQTDKWHDHKSVTFSDQCWELECKWFSTTSRYKSHDISPSQNSIYDFSLSLKEVNIAKLVLIDFLNKLVPGIFFISPLIVFLIQIYRLAYIFAVVEVIIWIWIANEVTIVIINFIACHFCLI